MKEGIGKMADSAIISLLGACILVGLSVIALVEFVFTMIIIKGED